MPTAGVAVLVGDAGEERQAFADGRFGFEPGPGDYELRVGALLGGWFTVDTAVVEGSTGTRIVLDTTWVRDSLTLDVVVTPGRESELREYLEGIRSTFEASSSSWKVEPPDTHHVVEVHEHLLAARLASEVHVSTGVECFP